MKPFVSSLAVAVVFALGVSGTAQAVPTQMSAPATSVFQEEGGTEQDVLNETSEALTRIAAIPQSVMDKGDGAVQEYLMANGGRAQILRVQRKPGTGSGLAAMGLISTDAATRGWWDRVKCVGAVTIAAVGVALPVAKITAIKNLIKAAGGAGKVAEMIVKVIKKKGPMPQKVKEVFGHLGAAAVGAAAAILQIDDVIEHCSKWND